MRQYGLFALLLTIFLVLPAVVNAAEQVKQNPVVKCERPAAEYLKDAEMLQRKSVGKEKEIDPSRGSGIFSNGTVAARTSLELYKVCSELEKVGR